MHLFLEPASYAPMTFVFEKLIWPSRYICDSYKREVGNNKLFYQQDFSSISEAFAESAGIFELR